MSTDHARVRRYTLFSVFLTIFLDLVGFGMFIPILPQVARDFSATNAQAAALSTYFSIGTLAAVLIFGRLSDKLGRKKILMFTIALSTLAQLATGFATTYVYLVIVRLVAGIASGNISVAQAAISDVTVPQERGRSMVVIGISFGAGFAVGPAIGALVSRFAPEHSLLAIACVAAVLNAANFFLVAFRLPETHHKFAPAKLAALIAEVRAASPQLTTAAQTVKKNVKQELAILWASRPLRVVLLLVFLQVFGFVGAETILPLVLKDAYGLSAERIYDVFVLLGVSVLFLNGYAARILMRKWGEVRTLNLGQVLLACGLAALPLFAPHLGLLPLGIVILASGTALANPSLAALTSRLAPPDSQGLAFGTTQSLGALARIVGPAFMGYLYDRVQGAPSLYVSAGLLAVGAVCGIVGLQQVALKFKNDKADAQENIK